LGCPKHSNMCWKNISWIQEHIGGVFTCVISYLLGSKKASINDDEHVMLYRIC
jgi:hypothetical protein